MYCTPTELMEMIKPDVVNTLIGDEYIEDIDVRNGKFTKLAEAAIEDADGEIDGYLASKHPVPLVNTPKIINKLSKDIALYNIFSRIGIDESERESNYLTRYKAAVRYLENVAKGITNLGIEEPVKRAGRGFSMSSSSRLFSRKSLRGM